MVLLEAVVCGAADLQCAVCRLVSHVVYSINTIESRLDIANCSQYISELK